MVSVPPTIQYQLGDAIGVIADSDFWERWDTLVDVREKDLKANSVQRADSLAGLGVSSYSGQSHHQQRSAASGPFDLQAMAATVPIRRFIHRNKSCT